MVRDGEQSWCLVVPHHARGARLARHRLAGELAGSVRSELLADVVAVLAELVGNAVRHADPLPGGVIRVAWKLRRGGPPGAGSRSTTTAGRDRAEQDVVEIRVTDGGSTAPPTLRPVGPQALDGRGLHIVAAIATTWGVRRDGLGQSVWAEVCAPARSGVDHDPPPATLDRDQPPAPRGRENPRPAAEPTTT